MVGWVAVGPRVCVWDYWLLGLLGLRWGYGVDIVSYEIWGTISDGLLAAI